MQAERHSGEYTISNVTEAVYISDPCMHVLFRPEYGYMNNITTYFPTVPIMALTATATPVLRTHLSRMLRDPIEEIATINKPNITLQVIELNNLPKHGTFIGRHSSSFRMLIVVRAHAGTESYYTTVADQLADLIQNKRALIYTDFVKDVVPFSIALSEKGISSWSYHGKNMSTHDKTKAVNSWCPEESNIQV